MIHLILTITLLFCSLLAKAQVQYGVQVSGILSNASITSEEENNSNKKPTLGFAAGVFAELSISDHVSVKPSLNFMQKGVKVSNEFEEENALIKQDLTANLNYIELPILTIYHVGGTNGKLFFGAGPSIGYGISGKLEGYVEIEDDGFNSSEYFNVDPFKDEEENGAGLKRFDVAIIGTVGYKLTQKITLGLSYIHGLSNISDTSDYQENKFKNRNFLMSLGYKL